MDSFVENADWAYAPSKAPQGSHLVTVYQGVWVKIKENQWGHTFYDRDPKSDNFMIGILMVLNEKGMPWTIL